VYTNTT